MLPGHLVCQVCSTCTLHECATTANTYLVTTLSHTSGNPHATSLCSCQVCVFAKQLGDTQLPGMFPGLQLHSSPSPAPPLGLPPAALVPNLT